jgi:REP element-mobilizing transposase RayT
MSRKYKAQNPEGLYFITNTVVGWVDLFTRPQYKDILVKSLKFCIENKGLVVHAYVIMTNHVHLIVSTKVGVLLSNVMRDFKTHTSKKLVEEIKAINESRREWLLNKFAFEAKRQARGKDYRLWQDGFHPVELLSAEMVVQKLEYIHNNPVAERWVDEAVHYVYSSARQYADEPGELPVEFLI